MYVFLKIIIYFVFLFSKRQSFLDAKSEISVPHRKHIWHATWQNTLKKTFPRWWAVPSNRSPWTWWTVTSSGLAYPTSQPLLTWAWTTRCPGPTHAAKGVFRRPPSCHCLLLLPIRSIHQRDTITSEFFCLVFKFYNIEIRILFDIDHRDIIRSKFTEYRVSSSI